MPLFHSSAGLLPFNFLRYSDLWAPEYPDPERLIPAGVLDNMPGHETVSTQLARRLGIMPSDFHIPSINSGDYAALQHAYAGSDLEDYDFVSNPTSNSSDDFQLMGLGIQDVDQHECYVPPPTIPAPNATWRFGTRVASHGHSSSGSTTSSILTPSSSYTSHAGQVKAESLNDAVHRDFNRTGQTMVPYGSSWTERAALKAWKANMSFDEYLRALSRRYKRVRSRYAELFKENQAAKIESMSSLGNLSSIRGGELGQLSDQDFDLLDNEFGDEEEAGSYFQAEEDRTSEPFSYLNLSDNESDLSSDSSVGGVSCSA